MDEDYDIYRTLNAISLEKNIFKYTALKYKSVDKIKYYKDRLLTAEADIRTLDLLIDKLRRTLVVLNNDKD